jgi:hypothetical protein
MEKKKSTSLAGIKNLNQFIRDVAELSEVPANIVMNVLVSAHIVGTVISKRAKRSG